jgi:asparagine synthase (glutamine-hydrolysing)
MCGFLLIASTKSGVRLPYEPSELDRLRDVLEHRGPDAGENWTSDDGAIALTHRRLKVIDLEASRQPLAGADGRYRMVFNGEIYNYRELRTELEGQGVPFRTKGDTEVLLEAYIRWGASCLERLNGMFAFAIWDTRKHTLFLARDHVGIKPLYYGWWDGRLYAASEAKAIVADTRVPRKIDPEALDLYFHHGYVPAPWAIWRGMRKLEAAHSLELKLDGDWNGLPEPRRYWDFEIGRSPVEPAGEEELLNDLEAALRSSVERQTVADVPLGAFLSGGVDSSLVVSYLAEFSDHPVRTFCVGYDDPRFDERPYAREVAKKFGTEHYEILQGPDSIDLLPSLARSYDEPFADPAALPTALVSKLAREHVTVALSGDGGDETHAGYSRFLHAQKLSRLDTIPLMLRRLAFGLPAHLAPSYKRRGLFEQASRDDADRYDAMTHEVPWDHRFVLYSEPMRERLREGEYASAGRGASAWRRELQARPGNAAEPMDRFQYVDLTSYLPEQLLVKMDRATMRVSLEARVPLLDLEATEFAMRIPAHWRVQDGRPKYLLRRLLARQMGDEFANRKKHGFRLPEVNWFGGMSRDRLEGYLRSDGLEEWLDWNKLTGFLLDSPRGLEFFWPFMAFSAWHRCYVAEQA